jgi:hypothetical protein
MEKKQRRVWACACAIKLLIRIRLFSCRASGYISRYIFCMICPEALYTFIQYRLYRPLLYYLLGLELTRDDREGFSLKATQRTFDPHRDRNAMKKKASF